MLDECRRSIPPTLLGIFAFLLLSLAGCTSPTISPSSPPANAECPTCSQGPCESSPGEINVTIERIAKGHYRWTWHWDGKVEGQAFSLVHGPAMSGQLSDSNLPAWTARPERTSIMPNQILDLTNLTSGRTYAWALERVCMNRATWVGHDWFNATFEPPVGPCSYLVQLEPTLLVQVLGGSTPVRGITVAVSHGGSPEMSNSVDQNGCASFTLVDPGEYAVYTGDCAHRGYTVLQWFGGSHLEATLETGYGCA